MRILSLDRPSSLFSSFGLLAETLSVVLPVGEEVGPFFFLADCPACLYIVFLVLGLEPGLEYVPARVGPSRLVGPSSCGGDPLS